MSKVKQSTINVHKSNLRRLEKYTDINNVNIDDLVDKMIKDDLPLSTQNSLLAALSWKYKKDGKPEKEIKKIGKEITDITYNIRLDYKENMLSDRELALYTTWNVIEKIYSIMEKNLTKRSLFDYVLLSLYVLHPPRRRLDYSDMYYDDIELPSDVTKIIWSNEDNIAINRKRTKGKINATITNKNYYVRGSKISFFVFDHYKTVDRYGRQVIEVDNKLKKIIDYYIDMKKIKKGTKLLNLTEDNLTKRLGNLFIKYIDKSISISMLRHIYINHIYTKSLLDKEIISMKMAHSKETQDIYRKKVEPETETKIEEEDMHKLRLIESGKKKIVTNQRYTDDRDRREAELEAKKRYYYKKKQEKEKLKGINKSE